MNNELMHYGILGMKLGVRRYQNEDGSLTRAGRIRYDTETGERLASRGGIAKKLFSAATSFVSDQIDKRTVAMLNGGNAPTRSYKSILGDRENLWETETRPRLQREEQERQSRIDHHLDEARKANRRMKAAQEFLGRLLDAKIRIDQLYEFKDVSGNDDPIESLRRGW